MCYPIYGLPIKKFYFQLTSSPHPTQYPHQPEKKRMMSVWVNSYLCKYWPYKKYSCVLYRVNLL